MAVITLDIGGNTRQLDRDIQRTVNKVYSINLKTKGNQPLGRITGQVNEFTKSLDASNARVIAFGASAGIIYNLQRAFTALVSSTIEVQKSLQDINVILNVSNQELQKFGGQLFNIARNTGQSFNDVAKAATEFSRQGLTVAETLKRTNEALILSRLSGLDAAKSVETLTAAVNSFASEAVTTTEVINKFANVDAAFAVSSADLAEAISRVGSSAAQSGVSLNELIAIVTSAQQTTARGGAVIGNSFKTIFTRLQRGKVLDLLESLGISTTDSSGQLKSTIQLLQDLGQVYDTLGTQQKAYVAEQVGGVFQINILKAALADLGKQYSVYNNALNVANSSSDQALKRNEQLNKSYAAQINALQENARQLASYAGEKLLGPSIDRLVGGTNTLLKGFTESDGKGVGAVLGKSILDGLGQFIAGPGIILIGGVLLKLFRDLGKFAMGSFKQLLGLNTSATQQKDLQQSINQILSKNPQLIDLALKGEQGLNIAANQLLGSLQKQTLELQKQATLSAQMSKAFIAQAGARMVGGVPVIPTPKPGRTGKAAGYIPNFASDKQIEKAQAIALGATPSVRAHMSQGTIGGRKFVMNNQEIEYPGVGSNGDSMVIPMYGNGVQMAAKGYIPNFAAPVEIEKIANSNPRVKKKLEQSQKTNGELEANDTIQVQSIKSQYFNPNINKNMRTSALSGKQYEQQAIDKVLKGKGWKSNKGLAWAGSSAIDGYRITGQTLELVEAKGGRFLNQLVLNKFLRAVPENYGSGNELDGLFKENRPGYGLNNIDPIRVQGILVQASKPNQTNITSEFSASRLERAKVAERADIAKYRASRMIKKAASGFIPNFAPIKFPSAGYSADSEQARRDILRQDYRKNILESSRRSNIKSFRGKNFKQERETAVREAQMNREVYKQVKGVAGGAISTFVYHKNRPGDSPGKMVVTEELEGLNVREVRDHEYTGTESNALTIEDGRVVLEDYNPKSSKRFPFKAKYRKKINELAGALKMPVIERSALTKQLATSRIAAIRNDRSGIYQNSRYAEDDDGFASGFIPNFAQGKNLIDLGDTRTSPALKGKVVSLIHPGVSEGYSMTPATASYLGQQYKGLIPVAGINKQVLKGELPDLDKNLGDLLVREANQFGQAIGGGNFLKSAQDLPNFGAAKGAVGVAFEGGLLTLLQQKLQKTAQNAGIDFRQNRITPKLRNLFHGAPGMYDAKYSPELVNDVMSKLLQEAKVGEVKKVKSGAGYKDYDEQRKSALNYIRSLPPSEQPRRGNALEAAIRKRIAEQVRSKGMAAGFIPNFAPFKLIGDRKKEYEDFVLDPVRGGKLKDRLWDRNPTREQRLRRVQQSKENKAAFDKIKNLPITANALDNLKFYRDKRSDQYDSSGKMVLYKDRDGLLNSYEVRSHEYSGVESNAITVENGRVVLEDYSPNSSKKIPFNSEFKPLVSQMASALGMGVTTRSALTKQLSTSRVAAIRNSPLYKAAGYIPNFAALQDAISRERSAGLSSGRIYVAQDKRLVASGFNPLGLGVFNTRDEPTASARSSAIKSRGYAGGYIPNFAEENQTQSIGSVVSALVVQLGGLAFILKGSTSEYKESLKALTESNIQTAKVNSKKLKADIQEQQKTKQVSSQQLRQETKQKFSEPSAINAAQRTALRPRELQSQRDVMAMDIRDARAIEKDPSLRKTMRSPEAQAERDLAARRLKESRQQQKIAAKGSRMQKFRAGGGAFGGAISMVAPMIASAVTQMIPQDTKTGRVAAAGTTAVGNIASMTAMGSMFGPIGTAVGFAAGALTSIPSVVEAFTTDFPELSAKADKSGQALEKFNQSVTGLQTASENLTNVMNDTNSSSEKIKKAQDAYAAALGEFSIEDQRRISEAQKKGVGQQEIEKIRGEKERRAQADQFTASVGKQAGDAANTDWWRDLGKNLLTGGDTFGLGEAANSLVKNATGFDPMAAIKNTTGFDVRQGIGPLGFANQAITKYTGVNLLDEFTQKPVSEENLKTQEQAFLGNLLKGKQGKDALGVLETTRKSEGFKKLSKLPMNAMDGAVDPEDIDALRDALSSMGYETDYINQVIKEAGTNSSAYSDITSRLSLSLLKAEQQTREANKAAEEKAADDKKRTAALKKEQSAIEATLKSLQTSVAVTNAWKSALDNFRSSAVDFQNNLDVSEKYTNPLESLGTIFSGTKNVNGRSSLETGLEVGKGFAEISNTLTSSINSTFDELKGSIRSAVEGPFQEAFTKITSGEGKSGSFEGVKTEDIAGKGKNIRDEAIKSSNALNTTMQGVEALMSQLTSGQIDATGFQEKTVSLLQKNGIDLGESSKTADEIKLAVANSGTKLLAAAQTAQQQRKLLATEQVQKSVQEKLSKALGLFGGVEGFMNRPTEAPLGEITKLVPTMNRITDIRGKGDFRYNTGSMEGENARRKNAPELARKYIDLYQNFNRLSGGAFRDKLQERINKMDKTGQKDISRGKGGMMSKTGGFDDIVYGIKVDMENQIKDAENQIKKIGSKDPAMTRDLQMFIDSVKSVGVDKAAKLQAMEATGVARESDVKEVRDKYSQQSLEMLKGIPGIGPKVAKAIAETTSFDTSNPLLAQSQLQTNYQGMMVGFLGGIQDALIKTATGNTGNIMAYDPVAAFAAENQPATAPAAPGVAAKTTAIKQGNQTQIPPAVKTEKSFTAQEAALMQNTTAISSLTTAITALDASVKTGAAMNATNNELTKNPQVVGQATGNQNTPQISTQTSAPVTVLVNAQSDTDIATAVGEEIKKAIPDIVNQVREKMGYKVPPTAPKN